MSRILSDQVALARDGVDKLDRFVCWPYVLGVIMVVVILLPGMLP